MTSIFALCTALCAPYGDGLQLTIDGKPAQLTPPPRLIDNAPSDLVDLDRAPGVVDKVEVELALVPGHADMYVRLRRIEMCLCLDDVEC